MGFEPTTSAESIVYGYPHALLNLLIPLMVGKPVQYILEPVLMLRGNIITLSVSSLARLRPLESSKALGPTEAEPRKLLV